MTATPKTDRPDVPRHPAAWTGWLLPLGFLAIAGALFFAPRAVDIPAAATPGVDRKHLEVVPLRVALSDPPQTLVGGAMENCNACHQVFESSHAGGAPLNYHQEIVLSHGLNNRCLNCHDPKDRERLTLRDGTTVPFSRTPMLCSQCHGTVYRDWERGTHGKTLGSWITGSPNQLRLSCNQCHDPHSPRYEPMAPLPPPNTLRMGEQAAHVHEVSPDPKQSPLQRLLKDRKTTPVHGEQPGELP